MVTTLLALSGLAQESMMRGVGWHFMEMGRRLERAWQTISQVRSLLVPVVADREEEVLLEAVLLSAEGLSSYQRRYNGQIAIANGLELLLLEPVNPRSLLYQLDRLAGHMDELPPDPVERGLPAFSRMILEAGTMLKLSDPWQLAQCDPGSGVREQLDQLLTRIQQLLADASIAITDRFFDRSGGPHPLLMESWEQSQ
jgi:uncharacterized alpha-E superfamily protein